MKRIAKRAIHARVSGGSGKDGDGWQFVCVGDIKAFIIAEINVRALSKGFQEGALGEIGKGQRPLTEIERDIFFKKRPLTLPKSRCKVRGDQGVATVLGCFAAMPGIGGEDKRILCLGQASGYPPAAEGEETGIGYPCCS